MKWPSQMHLWRGTFNFISESSTENRALRLLWYHCLKSFEIKHGKCVKHTIRPNIYSPMWASLRDYLLSQMSGWLTERTSTGGFWSFKAVNCYFVTLLRPSLRRGGGCTVKLGTNCLTGSTQRGIWCRLPATCWLKQIVDFIPIFR